jgi:hypothetical protein
MHPVEYEEFSRLLKIAHTAIKLATGIENLTLVQEESSIHFHLWFFPWTPPVLEKYGKPSLDKIRGIMADTRKQPISEMEWRKLEESIEKIKSYWQYI